MTITTKTLKSGRVLTSVILENGNQITFDSKGTTENEIKEYAVSKLNYEPVKKINLTNIISKCERLALC